MMDRVARDGTDARNGAAQQQAQFERLARQHYAGVYSYLCWLSRNRALAEDLTQETFLQIWQHPPEDRGERPLKAWVYHIARNEYLQYRRRAGLNIIALEEDAADAITAPAPHAELEQHEFTRTVQEAVEGLPDYYREVVVLHNLEGLSLLEVAAVLNVPVGTVKSRRGKAFSLLRGLLQEQEVVR